MNKENNITILHIIILFMIAFVLRVWGLNLMTEFYTSDHSQQVSQAVNYFENRTFFSASLRTNTFAGLISYCYGMGSLILIYLWISVLYLFGMTVNEFSVSIIGSLTGTFAVLGVYFFIKELTNNKMAFLSALLIAVEPYLIAQSRDIGRFHIITAITFAVWTLYFFVRYFNTGSDKYGWISSVFLACYISSSNLFTLLIPSVFCAGIIIDYCKTGCVFKSAVNVIKSLFKVRILLIPMILLSVYFSALIYSRINHLNLDASFFGKPMAKKKEMGIYFEYLSKCYIANTGVIGFGLMLIGFIFGLIEFIRLRKISILFITALIFTVPFLFMVPKDSTVIRVYIMESQVLWSILGILFILSFDEVFNLKKNYNYLKIIFYSFIILLYIAVTMGSVFNNGIYDKFNFGQLKESCGIMPYNSNGLKTLGYYVRNTYPESISMFSDLEPNVNQYYFARNRVYSQYDAGLSENYLYLKDIIEQMDIVALASSDENYYKGLLFRAGFNKIIEVADKSRVVRVVYSRSKMPLKVLDTQKYDRLFDEKYGRKNGLVPVKLDWPSENKPLPDK